MKKNALRSPPIWPDKSPAPFALDNGAWSAYLRGLAFPVKDFEQAVAQVGKKADFIVVPDVVGAGMESLGFSRSWVPRLLSIGPLLLIPVQDGVTAEAVRPILRPGVGIFVGGTTDWKKQTLRIWGDLAREQNVHLHVGRVNSARRIRLCQDAGAHSFDGSGIARFPSKLVLLDNNLRQMPLWSHHAPKS